jgi:adenylylsulfate kinase
MAMKRKVDIMENKHLTWHDAKIDKQQRQQANGHNSFVIWLTGLSGAGKSTLGSHLETQLFQRGIHTYLVDGDNLRMGMNSDLGFTERHRQENIRRAGELSKVLVDAGIVVIVALISPYHRHREFVRNMVSHGEFIEVYVKCPLEVCAKRDPKGLYEKAKQGAIKNFTGFDSPYEEPTHPELVIETDKIDVMEGTEQILTYLENQHLLQAQPASFQNH